MNARAGACTDATRCTCFNADVRGRGVVDQVPSKSIPVPCPILLKSPAEKMPKTACEVLAESFWVDAG